jgi:hypothetical protein
LALLTIVHRDNLLMLDRILMRLILLDCVRDLLLQMMMLLALLLRGHPLKLDLHPAVVHDHPCTSTLMLLMLLMLLLMLLMLLLILLLMLLMLMLMLLMLLMLLLMPWNNP